MKQLYFLFLLVFVFSAFAANADESVITKDLKNVLKEKSDSDLFRVNIRLTEQMNQLSRYAHLQNMKSEARRADVVNQLKSFSQQSQTDIMSFLNAKSSSSFKLIRQFWIANVITAYLDEATIYELAARSDIDRIDIDEERQLIESFNPKPVPFVPADKDVNEITYNVTKVNADDVWDLGYTGEGVIVSVIDAGINYNHLDLADHMWESEEYPNHGYDFHNDDNDPMDDHGHGTHCAGTVAGNGASGSQTGMAPGATLMACKVISSTGNGTESNSWAAIEFSVEQGAHVISMSLGWLYSLNPDRQTWRLTYDNALAAGVIASVAAGNEGGTPGSSQNLRTPGDCPSPWMSPDQTLEGGISGVVCVGATDENDELAYFSSRGPADWSTVEPFLDYPFDPEMGLLRPDVSAPGVDVKSCTHNNNSGYTLMSGTSMATPGVAGVMALLLSKNPGLTPEEITEVLETTSLDLGTEGKDNLFGAGRINALEAIENTSEQGPVYESHVFNDSNENGELEAGESVLLTMSMFNGSDMDYSDVDVTVSTESPYISMTDDNENYGDFPIGESVTIEEAFAFTVAEDMPGQQSIRFNVVATDGTEVWESKFDVISWGPDIAIGNLVIDDSDGNNNGRLDPGEDVILMIEMINNGQASLDDVQLELDYNGDYLTFSSTSFNVEVLDAGQTEYASFDINVSEDANIGQVDMFTADMRGGVYADSKDFVVVIGLILEDWETGDFSSFQWEGDGSEWFVTEQDPYEGLYCVQSAGIGHGEQSSLELEYEVGTSGTLSFFKRVSSESNYDYLRFFIDGVEQDSWSGEEAWSMEEYEVTEGLHTFKWEYDKDGSVSSGSDAAWVDYIIFPPMALPEIVMEDLAEICEDETYTSSAEAENYESLMWTSNGDGSFDDETIEMATYTPGSEDIVNGIVQLTLTAVGANGEVHKNLELHIYPLNIDAPQVPEGPQDLCINADDQIYTAVQMPGYELDWMLEPAEAGELMSGADSVVVMWADGFTGEAMLSVMTSSLCAQSEYSEALTINIHELPGMSMESNFDACYGQEFMMSADLTGTAPWIVNIEGYGDVSVENTPMEMSWIAMNDTSMTINWIQDANICVNEESVTAVVSVNEVPMVELQDSMICMNHEIVLDAGNPGAEFVWSTGETTQIISVDSAGMDENQQRHITVWVTNESDCTSEKTVAITYQDCSGIDELGMSQWSLYPNPSKGNLELELNSNDRQEISIEILSLQGQLLYKEDIHLDYGANQHPLDLTDLAPQTYLLILKNKDQQLIRKIVIE